MIYSFALAEGENKYIYNSRYAVILGGDNKYGLYDVKDEKILIEPSYEGIEYLYSDVFVGIKNGKSKHSNSIEGSYNIIGSTNSRIRWNKRW